MFGLPALGRARSDQNGSPILNRIRPAAGLILGTLLAIDVTTRRFTPKFRQVLPLWQKKLPGRSG